MAFKDSKSPFGQPMNDLEKKMINLQRSTGTALPFFGRIHNWLRMKNKWYYNWHLKPNSAKIHKAIAIVYTLGMLLTFVNFTLYYSVQKVQAASYTWDGGGTTNDWSDCNNWSTNVCPLSTDNVTFNSTSTKDSVVDASFGGTVLSVTLASGYTGTVSLSRSLNLTGTFSIASGTFTAGAQTLDIDTNFAISGGTFNAPSTTMLIGRDVTITAGTFNHNNGTVTFDGASTGNLACNNATFNSVTFNQASNATKTIGAACSFPLGANPTVPGTITLAGTLSGSGTYTNSAGTFTYNGGTLSGFGGLSLAAFQVSSGTFNLGNFSPVSISSGTTVSAGTLNVGSGHIFTSNFVLSGGTFNVPSSGTVQFNGTFNAASGTFNHNNGTVIFGGTTTATLTCTVATFNSVSFTHVNNPKTVSSSCSLPLGADPTISGPIVIVGTLSGSGTLSETSTMTLNSGAALSGFTGLVANNTFTMNGATFDMTGYTTADFNGIFALTSGTFTAPSGIMTVANNITYTAGTFNHNNGTVISDGSAGTINCGSMVFNLVQFNFTSSKTVSAGCNLPLGADPSIPSSVTLNGTLTGTGTLNVQSNTLTMNSGSALSGFTGMFASAAGNLNITGATVDMSTYTSFNMSSFTISSGSFTAPTAGMQVRSNFTGSSGTFNGNGSVLTLSSSGTITCSGATITFGTVSFTHSVGTRLVNGCTLPMGNDPSTYQTNLTNATLTGTGTLTITGSMVLNAGGALSGFTGFVGNNVVTLSGGTLDFIGYSTVDLNSTININSGTFTAPSGVMTVASNITYTGGTFNHSNGTVTLDGSSATISCGTMVFNLVVMTSGKTLSSGCTLPLGENPTITTLTSSGTLTGTGTLTTTGFITNAGAALSGFSGLQVNGTFTNQGATLDLSGYTTYAATGTTTVSSGTLSLPNNADLGSIVLSGGTLNAPSGTITASGTVTLSGGTFNHNNGTVVFDGASATLSCGNAVFNLVRIDITAANTKTVNSDCTLPLGANPMVNGGISLTGVLSGSGKLTVSGALTLTNNGSQSGILSGFTGLSTGSNLTVQTRATDITDLSGYDTVTIGGQLILTSGTFSAPKVLNVSGNFTRTDGVFIHNNNTVNLTGRDQVVSGSNTFYNFSKVRADTAAILWFSADSTQTILNDLTLKGYSTSLRMIVLPTPSSGRYKLDAQGTRSLANLDVRNTDNSNAKKINMADTGSFYRNTNTGFVWFTPTVTSLGPTTYTNGSSSATTTPAVTFTTADTDAGDTVSYQIQIDDSSDYTSPAVDYTSALAAPAANTFTVGQAGTYAVGAVGQKLSDGNYFWRVRATDSNGSVSGWITATTTAPAFVINTDTTGSATSTPTPTVTSTPATGSLVELRVSVLDDNGNPAAGAEITLYSEPRHATADDQGIAHFSEVPVGEHTLVVSYNGKVGEKQILVEAEPENFATLTAEAKPVEVTVKLKETKPFQEYLWLIPTMLALLVIIILMILRLVHYKKYHPGQDTELLP